MVGQARRLTAALALLSIPSSAQSVGNCSPRVVVGSPTTDGGDGGPAVKAQLFGPTGLAKDAAGNLYIADSGNNKIRVVRPDGTIQTIAGTGVAGSTGDGGPARLAQFNNPVAVAVGPDSDVYVVENNANRVRKITNEGMIQAVAGNGQRGFAGDGGPASQARLMNPSAAAFDTNGNLYISDTGNYRVRRVTKDGTISTFAGVGYKLTTPYPSDGVPAVGGYVELPGDLAFASDGTLYIAARGRVESVTPDGQLHTVTGINSTIPAVEGQPAKQAYLDARNIAVNAQGELLVTEYAGLVDTVWKITPEGTLHNVVSTYQGSGLLVGGDGTITRSVYSSNQIMSYTGGPLSQYTSPHRVVAGVWALWGTSDAGPGTLAAIEYPGGIAADTSGNVYITDTTAGKIRKLNTRGMLTTIAGTGGTASTPDGLLALQSVLNNPTAIAVSRSGEIYYAEQDSYRVRKIGTDNLITTVAGNGQYPPQYGSPWSQFSDIREGKPATTVAVGADTLAVAGDGTLYIVDPTSAVIWRVTTDGILHTALRPNDPSVLTDTRYPFPLAADPGGSIYYLERSRLNLMRLTGSSAEVIRNIGDYFSRPSAFTIDGAGNLYLVDGANLVKLPPDGTVSVLTNTRTPGPTAALRSVALDGAGNLFATDGLGRVVEVPSGTTCTASVFPRIVVEGGVNAASYEPYGGAPGEMVSIFGIAVGPAKPAKALVDASGKLATKIGETQVLFDGIPAPIIYASSTVTIAVVPFGVSSQWSTTLQLSVNGFLSNIESLQVADVQPGIFTHDASGSGQAVALNQGYSVNSAANPAKKGSVVQVYATGLGVVNPPVPDGVITGNALSRHVQDVTAWVAGNQADVLYAGTAPGIVSGASAINIRIPPQTPSGNVSLWIKMGAVLGVGQSQTNVTIAVQ